MSESGCPAPEHLERLAREELPADEAALLLAHASGCSSCARALAQLAGAGSTGPTAVRPQERTGATREVEATVPTAARPPELSGPLPRGTAIGRYLVLGQLGEGGMGVVYLAHDSELDRKVALKLVRADSQDDSAPSAGRARLLREAQAMAKLSHGNVVAIHDVGTFEEKVFLAMEYVEGQTLKRWMREKPRPWREVLAIFREAGRGLAAAHAAGLIHRDFKPDNVLIGKDGRVRVTDFGLARARVRTGEAPPWAAALPDGNALASPLTAAGTVMGTPAYMAPEQLIGPGIDERTDVFAFCVALYEALYGERPFENKFNPDGTRAMRPVPRDRDVPAWLREIVLRGVATKPAERPPSMEALLELLARDPALRRKRLLTLGAGATAFAALAAVAVLGWSHRKPDPCEHPERGLAGVWDDAAKQAGRAAFVAVGGARADAAWSRLEKAMDRAAGQWLAGAKAACDAARVQHSESEVALQLRLTCLNDQLEDWRGLLDFYRKPDAKLIEHAVASVAALPRPQDCAGSANLALIPQVPPQVAPTVAALRKRLAHARILDALERWDAAAEELEPLFREARATGYCPLQVKVALERARSVGGKGDFLPARDTEKEALDLAIQCRMGVLAARAAAWNMAHAARAGAAPAELRQFLAQTEQLVNLAGNDVETERAFYDSASLVYSVLGDDARALDYIQKEVALVKAAYGEDDATFQYAEENLAVNLDNAGRHEEALEANRHAREAVLARSGPESGDLPLIDSNIDCLLADLGRWDEAEALATANLTPSAPHTADVATFYLIRANGRARRGEHAAALDDLGRGLAIIHEVGFDHDPESASVANFSIETYLLAGRPAEAVAVYEANASLQEKAATNAVSQSWFNVLREGGKAYLAAGQPAKAREVLERALAMAPSVPQYPGWASEVRYELARALLATGGDKERAAALATQAREELAKLPFEASTVAELDGWRANELK